MEILGIGIPELLFIILLILILLGPKDMVAAGKTLGRWLNQLIHSPTYKLLTKTGDELKNLPRNLMREANLEEYQKEIQGIGKQVNNTTNSIGSAIARSFDEKQIFASAPSEKSTEAQSKPESNPEPTSSENITIPSPEQTKDNKQS